MGTNKCEFELPRLTLFGHQVTQNGVETGEERVTAIQNTHPPRMPATHDHS